MAIDEAAENPTEARFQLGSQEIVGQPGDHIVANALWSDG